MTEKDELKRDEEGRFICPNCSKSIDGITQIHYDCFEWDEKLKKYCKFELPGNSQETVCCECGEYLDTRYAWLLDEENERKDWVTKEKKKELEKVILYDLEALKDCFIVQNRKDFDYHFKLLKGNLKDYFYETIE